MTEKENQPSAANLPLGRTFRLEDLPGRISKKLVVPPGRLGVVIYPDGSSRTFPPGEHRLLSAWQRLQGKGIGMTVGYLRPGEIAAGARLACLLSGDRELLDAHLVCLLEIQDAVRFFSEFVAPRGELRETILELDPQLLQEALGAITTHYAAIDLEQGRVSAPLLAQIRPHLELLLGKQGLSLKEIHPLIFSRAENRAVIAQKTQELAERLQDVELQAKMAAIENQVQLDDFLQQVAPGLQQVAHLNADVAQEAQGKGKGSVADMLRAWVGLESTSGKEKRPWSLGNLFQKKQAAGKKGTRPEIRRVPVLAWLPRLIWMAFIIVLAFSSSWIAEWIAPQANLPDRLQFHFAVWGIAIPILLESLNALYVKRLEQAEQAEHSWMLPGYQQLDNLVGDDRHWADELVREQCARELTHIREMVETMRSMEYKRGNTILALKLRNEVEQNASRCAEKVQQTNYGQPPYVSDLHVSHNAWLHMLDYDEELLLLVHALSEQAKLLQQKAHTAELTEAMITRLNADITQFCNRFFERGRPLQVPAAAAES